jgi:hypothetical protein
MSKDMNIAVINAVKEIMVAHAGNFSYEDDNGNPYSGDDENGYKDFALQSAKTFNTMYNEITKNIKIRLLF